MARSSSALAVVQTPFEAAAARTRESVALRDLDIAPENLRAGEAPDDDIPVLADTLFAAGQLQPITVRPGCRKEASYMALDGRRRLLAFRLLLEQGRIEETFPVDVFVETDAARQAAAVVLTNTAVPVHVADVIAAIGRMLKSKLGVPDIARALGHAEVDVKRLAALSALPEVALDALRGGRLTLRQARLLARLPDQDEQAELAQAALDGHGFADWRITERLDRSQVSANDPRCALVSPNEYAAGGGRIEADLFGERAPILLDPAILTDLWTARAGEIAQVFEAEGYSVHVTAGDPPDLPDDLEQAGYVYGGMLPADEMAAYREARSIQDAAADAVESALGDGADPAALDRALEAMIRASLVVAQIAFGGRAATTLVFSPSRRTALQVAAWTPLVPAADEEETGETDDDVQTLVQPGAARFTPPQAEAPAPDVEGVGHSLHRLRTEVATRGLIRALADDPRTAMTALIVRMFQVVASRGCHLRADSGLTITAQVFSPRDGQVIASLDGVVRERLDDRRAAWEASGQTLVRWVHGLDDEDRSAFLADLVALTLDLTEARTDALRSTARAEACELAELARADIARHWTPDADFLNAHPKGLLLGMLEAMGKAAPSGAAPGKADLVLLVEATAAARGWAPAVLSWGPAVETAQGDPAAGDGTASPVSEASVCGDADGVGAFEITAEGHAALATAAD
ncbi:ParB/RepB/Spo0J family partition protein [Brevundimonas diminuta]|uniref:Chromosome partitioning protein ParB n=1 Tax=Brevundimonas diminuta TaxID=293 RepID=A0A410NT02_BREDI|nr:ParB N-terminal domain-containing protein [Brevundimonas diminuta]QAT13040.1 chromosome partitioning protein ParB [Brevundimonas diminuta]QQB89613.1 ParB N-terminal domain-containing protein [Brevundimonas diminuta]GEC01829.1 hypothetical protein BDI01nite_28930 [Brevundimonas diminuta]